MQAKNGRAKGALVVGVELPGRRTRFGEPVVKSCKKYRDIVTELLWSRRSTGRPFRGGTLRLNWLLLDHS